MLTITGLMARSPKVVGMNNFMQDNNIDILQFDSAVKVGAQGTIDINTINSASLSIYPNPATNQININGSENSTKIVISNILGKKVVEINSPTSSINIESLKKGIYFITLFNGKETTTKKLIKK